MQKAKEKNVKIHIPVDFLTADKFEESANTQVRNEKNGIEDGWFGLDIGPETLANNLEIVSRAKTIFWNGPQGVFEMKPFALGSTGLLEAVVKATEKGTTSVVGGGDTVNLLNKVKGSADKISHVSTGGGASLELVEGKELPGITALSEKSDFVK